MRATVRRGAALLRGKSSGAAKRLGLGIMPAEAPYHGETKELKNRFYVLPSDRGNAPSPAVWVNA